MHPASWGSLPGQVGFILGHTKGSICGLEAPQGEGPGVVVCSGCTREDSLCGTRSSCA